MKVLIVRPFPSMLDVRQNTYNIQEIGLAKALNRRGCQTDLLFWTDGEEAEITGYLPFTSAYIQSGKNAGKKLVDLNNELLIQLGMKPAAGGYIDPAKLTEELEEKEARFVVDYENDQNGKPHLRQPP